MNSNFYTFENHNTNTPLSYLSALSNISKHNDHWGAVMGYDWMVETPSLIFTEIDDSESIGVIEDIECLTKAQNGAEIRAFLFKNKLITAFPVLNSSHYTNVKCSAISDWNSFPIERTVQVTLPNQSILSAFCVDSWNNKSTYQPNADVKLGFSAFPYRMSQSSDEFSLKPMDEYDDEGTSYEFSGGQLSDIEPAETFYHLGWFANLNFPEESDLPPIRVWIHKKNIEGTPNSEARYSGTFWLQCSLEAL
ncbi:MAG: hypothetical protein HWD92_06100 [Flavobacteriia bacterium]|nr:hypothetical protein [Flavobacteriia bacterium]